MVCRYEHLLQPWFNHWNERFGLYPVVPLNPGVSYRKSWEWCAIAEALHGRGMLRPGRRGLGFAVGQEPVPALFASHGAEILATDLATDLSQAQWIATGQHAASRDALFRDGMLDRAAFDRLVTFQPADMRTLEGLPRAGFDFLWSSCSLEHLGTIETGFSFVERAMDLLKPGGVAVHTTEYNCSSNEATVTEGGEVIFRRRDIETLDHRLRHLECGLGQVDFFAGDHPHDLLCDNPPYFQSGRMHLKLRLHGFVATSILLVVTKP